MVVILLPLVTTHDLHGKRLFSTVGESNGDVLNELLTLIPVSTGKRTPEIKSSHVYLRILVKACITALWPVILAIEVNPADTRNEIMRTEERSTRHQTDLKCELGKPESSAWVLNTDQHQTIELDGEYLL
jgi:hypothetical protein